MIQKYSLYFAWLLACAATLGSLYFSEILHFEPCRLCWYQRIAIYPLVFILGIATYREFNGIVPYILPQLIFGIIIAAYEVTIQAVPNWQPIDLCGAGPSCADKIDIGLGPISLPMLSLGAMILMLLFLFMAWKKDKMSMRAEA